MPHSSLQIATYADGPATRVALCSAFDFFDRSFTAYRVHDLPNSLK